MFPTAAVAREIAGNVSKKEFYSKYFNKPIQVNFNRAETIIQNLVDSIITGKGGMKMEYNNWHIYGEEIRNFFKPLGYNIRYREREWIVNGIRGDFLYISYKPEKDY